MRVAANGLGRGAEIVRSASAMAGEAQEEGLLERHDDDVLEQACS